MPPLLMKSIDLLIFDLEIRIPSRRIFPNHQMSALFELNLLRESPDVLCLCMTTRFEQDFQPFGWLLADAYVTKRLLHLQFSHEV
jgi:hypothetical protein